MELAVSYGAVHPVGISLTGHGVWKTEYSDKRDVVECFPVNNHKILFRIHAVQRMFERRISAKKVTQALQAGETIEDYSSETPEPSRLILGFQGKRPFHVVVSENPQADETTVITVYLPSAEKWSRDFKSRRA